ncbi:hypothetical protein OG883_43655 [Streptomyces sp. NBC_01142]|uniref:hypothetical protein n=1 Tax=Streptomyces sp. NBC_01142 TaxID=2975865 RepID=UPI002258054F|nr:hypothetical protein [Streptomyces sp. NBC_01142]MCX4826537.1 hypothetical protein [Streptomyces sp. NBC_01142]
MTRPLGRHQLTVLGALARLNGGTWSAGCAWQLRSATYTARVLDTLVQRGYVTRTSESARYAITEDGLNALGWYTCEGCTRLTRSPAIEQPSASERRVRCSWCHAPDSPPPSVGSRPGRTRPHAARAHRVPA